MSTPESVEEPQSGPVGVQLLGDAAALHMPPPPHHLLVDGVPVTMMVLPGPAPGTATSRCPTQPMLPLEGAPSTDRPRADAERARGMVARLARTVVEVLDLRRPTSQLRDLVDDDSIDVIAAWTRLGALRHCTPGAHHAMVVSPTHVEGSFTLVTPTGRHLAAPVTLVHDGRRWRCTQVRVLAPDALVTRSAA